MLNTIISQPVNFTRQDLNFVANVAYAKAGMNKPLARAIDRALVMLSNEQWSFDGLHFTVRSSDNTQTYIVNTTEPMHCSCKGRQSGHYCKHVVAARLLVRAAEHHVIHVDIDFSKDVAPQAVDWSANAAWRITNEAPADLFA